MTAAANTYRLTLIRHAKSSWKYPKISDIDRPLNKRGRRDALLMANRLAERGFSPDQVFCSPALRTLRTIEAIIDTAHLDYTRLTIVPALYMAEAEEMGRLINSCNSRLSWIALVGHNPGITALANALSAQALVNVPTLGVVDVTFATSSWIKIGKNHLVDFIFDYPKKSLVQSATNEHHFQR
jgi:phosphohistidine phosphatase